MKRRTVLSGAAASFAVAIACSGLAAEGSDAKEARELLNEAVAYFEKTGAAKAFCAFNDPSGAFHKGALYVFALDTEGVYLAHSAAPTLVGTSLHHTRDAAGQPIIRTIMKAAGSQSEGSVDYLWLNYVTNKVEKKHSFVKRVGEFVLGVGYYTP